MCTEQSKTREQRRSEFIQTAPVTCQGQLAKAFAGKASPRQAIKAHCLACTGFVRTDVRDCASALCPLYAYRPYQSDQGDEDRDQESADQETV